MEIDDIEWVTLREAEKIIGRSRRQIWRYIHDGSWDTRAVMDNLNRQVTYVKLGDIRKKKAELELASDLNIAPIAEEEPESTIVQQQLEQLIASQEYQNSLIEKCLYVLERINLTFLRIFMFVVLIGIVVVAICSILNIISD